MSFASLALECEELVRCKFKTASNYSLMFSKIPAHLLVRTIDKGDRFNTWFAIAALTVLFTYSTYKSIEKWAPGLHLVLTNREYINCCCILGGNRSICQRRFNPSRLYFVLLDAQNIKVRNFQLH